MKIKDSDFYCAAKKCRKTAWDTPEYLSDNDWILVERIINSWKAADKNEFDKILYEKNIGESNSHIFFNRIIGWPEGNRYYPNAASDFYFNNFLSRDLERLKKAFEEHINLFIKVGK